MHGPRGSGATPFPCRSLPLTHATGLEVGTCILVGGRNVRSHAVACPKPTRVTLDPPTRLMAETCLKLRPKPAPLSNTAVVPLPPPYRRASLANLLRSEEWFITTRIPILNPAFPRAEYKMDFMRKQLEKIVKGSLLEKVPPAK